MNCRLRSLALVAFAGCASAPAPAAPAERATEGAAPSAPEPAAPATEAVAEPIDCAGEETVAAEGITIAGGEGPAVRARGGCSVTLVDVELHGRVGVDAGDRARVTLRDSRVRGVEAAVVVTGEARVALPNTEAFGEVRLGGSEGDATDG